MLSNTNHLVLIASKLNPEYLLRPTSINQQCLRRLRPISGQSPILYSFWKPLLDNFDGFGPLVACYSSRHHAEVLSALDFGIQSKNVHSSDIVHVAHGTWIREVGFLAQYRCESDPVGAAEDVFGVCDELVLTDEEAGHNTCDFEVGP